MSGRRTGYARRHHGDEETGVDPLRLFTAWLEGANGFARPAPPADDPLPLIFTCRGCGGRVNPGNGKCSGCKSTYQF